MATKIPRALIEVRYHEAEQEYLRSLPPEHFMEATPQATQREITLESLALVRAARSDFHLFNELLVQYPRKHQAKPGQVVPDNMVVVYNGTLHAQGSYNTPVQPALPFWVLEYVSKETKRKDYDDNMRKYERELKVPYYLLFYPDAQELTLYHHNGRRYVSVKPNSRQRYPIKELELEAALVDGWVRFWFRGELLPLPADLQQELNETRRELIGERQARQAAEQRSEEERQARQAAEQRSEEERQARQAAEQRSEEEHQARQAAEQELARLRAEMQQMKRRRNHK